MKKILVKKKSIDSLWNEFNKLLDSKKVNRFGVFQTLRALYYLTFFSEDAVHYRTRISIPIDLFDFFYSVDPYNWVAHAFSIFSTPEEDEWVAIDDRWKDKLTKMGIERRYEQEAS